MTKGSLGSLPRIYLDACVFIDYLDNGPYASIFEETVEASLKSKCDLITSMITITEVAYSAYEKHRKKLDDETMNKIDKLWLPASGIELIPVHEIISMNGRALLRSMVPEGWTGTKSVDAVHLATAQREHATEMWSTEHRMQRWTPIVGIPIHDPRRLGEVGGQMRLETLR